MAAALVAMPAVVGAQGAQVAFGGLKHDASQPIEVTSDQLQINQQDGSVTYRDNVVIGQGSLRLSADRVRVEFGQGKKRKISKLHASGNVILVNGAESAQAHQAVYTLGNSHVVMSGDVILTQGQNALSAQRMVVDLKTGQASLEGRVKTILQASGN